jgi:hypothetical protein
MSDGIVGNLKDAWGVEDDGPDPNKLPGLLELSEDWLEEEGNDPAGIAHHFETMRNRVVGAHMERSQALKSGKVTFDSQFATLVQKNLADMELVEAALDQYIEGSSTGDREECWDALGALEEAVEAMKQSGDAIEAFLNSSPLVCMGCSSIGPEHICPRCGGERLHLDPSPRTEDERKVAVSDEVLAVYESYQAVLMGKGPMTELVTNLQSLEFTYLEAQAIGEQTLTNEAATDRIKSAAGTMLEAITATLSGIERMHAVLENRATAELTAGWQMILDNSVEAQKQLNNLNTTAEELVDDE